MLRRHRNPLISDVPTAKFLWRNSFLSDVGVVILEEEERSSGNAGRGPTVRAHIPSHAAVLCTQSPVLRTLIEVLHQQEARPADSSGLTAEPTIGHHQQQSMAMKKGSRGQCEAFASGPSGLNISSSLSGMRSEVLNQQQQQQPSIAPRVTLRVGRGQLPGTLLMLQAMYDMGGCLTKVADSVKLQASSAGGHSPLRKLSSSSRFSITPHQWTDNPLAEAAAANQTHDVLLVPTSESDEEESVDMPGMGAALSSLPNIGYGQGGPSNPTILDRQVRKVLPFDQGEV